MALKMFSSAPTFLLFSKREKFSLFSAKNSSNFNVDEYIDYLCTTKSCERLITAYNIFPNYIYSDKNIKLNSTQVKSSKLVKY